MRIWPVILDSCPSYFRGSGASFGGRARSATLLFAPLGGNIIFEHLLSSLEAITGNAPLIVAPPSAPAEYGRWIAEIATGVRVTTSAEEFVGELSTYELSDALLIIDPNYMPIGGFQFESLVREHSADPRVAHHLVALEVAPSGTKERVCVDSGGRVRSIQRYYEEATWPFVSGIAASLVPCACGIQADGLIPRSLSDLRSRLVIQGIPSRDLPVEGGVVNLGEESGLLAASGQLVLRAGRSAGDGLVLIGGGQKIDSTVRTIGPVIVHEGARVADNVTILGPTVIGPCAHIESGVILAHAAVGSDSVIPAGAVVRDRAWFGAAIATELAADLVLMSYPARLSRTSLEAHAKTVIARRTAPVFSRPYATVKRVLDALIAAVSLLLFSPLFAIIAAAIRLESGAPVFYGDKREGLGSRVFQCWKFRTMFTGAHLAQRNFKELDHTDGPHFKIERDPRVTKVGRVLRALNLDEIPQLWNVLVGEMSLIGPRPSPFRENQVCVPWREARLSVRPGITGFWQVCRHNRQAGDFHQWIDYDLLYVRHLSFVLDLKILFATIGTLGGKALHVPPTWLVGAAALARSRSASEKRNTREEDDQAVAV